MNSLMRSEWTVEHYAIAAEPSAIYLDQHSGGDF